MPDRYAGRIQLLAPGPVADLVHAQFSTQLLGTYIDAVYHTSIVFGGAEVFFGLGVQTCRPGSTHHGECYLSYYAPINLPLTFIGAPMEIIRLGKTSLPEDVISEYLDSLKQIYTAEVGATLDTR